MDLGLLVIFLLAGFWLYGALVLSLGDWRWNAGRILQYTLCAGLGAWMIHVWRQPTSVPFRRTLLGGALVVFAVNVLGAALAQRRMIGALAAGRIRRSRLWRFLLVFLTWRPPSTLFGGLPDAALRAPEGSRQARRIGRMLARIYTALSRRVFLHRRIEALVASGFHDRAIDLFESSFGPGRLEPDRSLYYAMAVAFSEIRDLNRASAMLLTAEESSPRPRPDDPRRFAAHLRVYSACGRVEQLERFRDRNPVPASVAPPAAIRYRLAVAHLRAGDADGCARMLIEAMGRTRSGEEDLQRAIAERLETLPEAAEPVELAPQTKATLDRIADLEQRPRPSEKPAPSPPRAVVTWAIVLAAVLVWLVTEMVGSSQDDRTLMQLGANVSMLVRYGEWWRLVSSVFLHVGWLHLFFNAYACSIFGAFVERSSGRWHIFVIFLTSGIAGSVASAFLGAHVMSAGASGGVFGLVGAATVIALRFKDMFPTRIRRFLVTNFLFIAALNVAYGLMEPHIDNLAHGGGFAAGVALGFCLREPGEDRLKGVFRAVGIVLLAVLAVASALQVRYAAGEPYPRRLPPFRSAIGWDGDCKAAVPVFWQRVRPRPREMTFLDPFGAVLSIDRGEADTLWKLGPKANERIVSRGVRKVGTMDYDQVCTEVFTPEGRFMTYRFRRPAGAYSYLVTFECSLDDADAYQPLLTRILLSLEIAESPSRPGSKMPPVVPTP